MRMGLRRKVMRIKVRMGVMGVSHEDGVVN